MISSREKAFLHIYPDLASMSDQDRRDVLVHAAGVESSADPRMTHDGVNRAMAAYETILWYRVDKAVVPDPRKCPVCGRPMRHIGNGYGDCPEGCVSRRRIHAWDRTYWRQRLPAQNGANTRQIWKIKELWSLLQDYLPEESRTDVYLAGIIEKAAPRAGIYANGAIAWQNLAESAAHLAIEALKDRLRYAVRGVGR
jgi:hypothetical protein